MRHENMFLFRLAQIKAMCLLALAYIISLFYKKKLIYLIAERGVDARDNGYAFFVYLKEQHPEIDAYYAISNNSADKSRLEKYKDYLLPYRSLQHYIMIWRADVLISTHLHGYFPFGGLGVFVQKICPAYRRKCHVFLQHGITKDYMPYLDYLNAPYDLFITAVQPEYDYMISAYHYPVNKVALTGFCRFDNLHQKTVKRQILLMPTWREWLYRKTDFIRSEYLKTYTGLLQNTTLHQILDQYNIDLIFYPHHEIQKFISYFNELSLNQHIIIANKKDYDVQDLLKQSALLVTDYSSVFFDFAYMRKPVVFYQFDRQQFRQQHYQQGWFDYDNGLGQIAGSEKDCLSLIIRAIETDFKLESPYIDRINQLFQLYDTNNCQRVFDAIKKAAIQKHIHYATA